MGVGAEAVFKTLRGYEGVPGAVIVDKWINDSLARRLAVRLPRLAQRPELIRPGRSDS